MSKKLRMLPLPFALIATLWLNGCATDSIKTPSACPVPVVYSQEVQTALAEEVTKLSLGSKILLLLGDYARERASLKALSDQSSK